MPPSPRTPPLLVALLLLGCGGGADPVPASSPLGPVPKEPQRQGDPAAGYHALVNNGYVNCGIPYSAYSRVFTPAPDSQRLPGRDGHNAELPYYYTAFTTKSGVEVVSANCLLCHAGEINGAVVVGLGDASLDLTLDRASEVDLAGALVTDPAEKAEWRKFADRTDTVAARSVPLTAGVNTADNVAAVLFAHRDPQTLGWSDDELIPIPTDLVVPVHVPPWWRMKKKNAMFYSAGGRGDHARIMMTASTLCTDSVPDAEAIDAYFPDIRAYVYSLSPPPYPFAVDAALADRGRAVFGASCARCHGSYGQDGQYPNLVLSLDEVGTDRVMVEGSSQFAGPFVNWFNNSFYGRIAQLAPAPGYIAPPLDGIWATAPYLHNGSVPTIAALLDSSQRPRYWTRSFDSKDYDQAALGFRFTALDHGQAAETDSSKRKLIYDTTQLGYSNAGHTFGDVLSAADRAAVIEYLKTL